MDPLGGRLGFEPSSRAFSPLHGQGRARIAGLAAIAGALALWQVNTRPDVLISDTGALVGVLSDEGRVLSRSKGAGFVARNWLENDGDGRTQETAAALWQGRGGPVLHLHGKKALTGFDGCAAGTLVVASGDVAQTGAEPCLILDPALLRSTGAIALYLQDEKVVLVTARDKAGTRMWSGWRKDRMPDLEPPDISTMRVGMRP